MSNSSRNVRGILAVALLTAGAGWTMVSPASAEVVPCQERDTPAACEGTGEVGVTATVTGEGGVPVAPGDAGVSVNPYPLTRLAYLPELSQASSLTSFADAGGVAAGSGLHALPFGLSSPPGHEWTNSWVGVMTASPDLPGLPGAPVAPSDGISWLRAPVPPAPQPPAEAAVTPGGEPAPLPAPANVVTEDSSSAEAPSPELPATELPAAQLPAMEPPAVELPSSAGPGNATLPGTTADDAVTAEGTATLPDLPALERTVPGLRAR